MNRLSLEDLRASRAALNQQMMEADTFFREFGALDDGVYAEGAIGRKHKELTGLAISVTTRCDECVLYHLGGCWREGARQAEIVEAIKIGVIAGGAITFPNARFAFAAMEDEGMTSS